MPLDGKGDVEARLGDFDFKCPDRGKREYWREIEEQLIDEGWYTGRKGADVEADRFCTLSKST